MKHYFLIYCLLIPFFANAQSLQLHYDLRHEFNAKLNSKNYPTLYFEYYRQLDSGKRLIKPGAFLLKTQADFAGDQTNIGKYFMQVSQEVRFWRPPVFVTFQYAGGLGVTSPREYSYYITNTYEVGASYHFKIGNAFLSSVLFYKYVPYVKGSHDFLYTMYFYKGLWNYRAELSGDFSIWTENKNHGDNFTNTWKGKRFYFFAEPQFWLKVASSVAIGTKVNCYYHINFNDNLLEMYPTAAIRLKLN